MTIVVAPLLVGVIVTTSSVEEGEEVVGEVVVGTSELEEELLALVVVGVSGVVEEIDDDVDVGDGVSVRLSGGVVSAVVSAEVSVGVPDAVASDDDDDDVVSTGAGVRAGEATSVAPVAAGTAAMGNFSALPSCFAAWQTVELYIKYGDI